MSIRDLRSVISHNVALRARELGVSQAEVARKMGYSRRWTHRRTAEGASIRLEELPRLMKVLEIDDPNWLFVDRFDPLPERPRHSLPMSVSVMIQPPIVR